MFHSPKCRAGKLFLPEAQRSRSFTELSETKRKGRSTCAFLTSSPGQECEG